jgi:hypothetical protein
VHLLVFFFIVVAIFVFFISPLSLLFISRFNTSPMLHVPGHCRSLPLVFDPAHSVLPVLARPYGCFALLSRCVHHRAIREALRAAVLVTCAGYAGDGERPPGLLPSQQGVHKFWQEKLDLPNKGAPGGRRRRRGGGYFNFVPILDISDVLVITTPLTQVMVSDACVWVQQVSDRHWNQFSTALGAAMVAVEQKGIATGVGGKMATQIAKAEAALAAEMASDSDDEEDESESSEDDSSEDNS